jgi:hypothetical protein
MRTARRARAAARRRGLVFARVICMGRPWRSAPRAASPEPDDARGRAIADPAAMPERIARGWRLFRRTLPVGLAIAAAAAPAAAAQPPVTGPTVTLVSDGTLLAQANVPPSGTGGKNAGESANIWDGFVGFLGWVLLALTVAGFLVWALLGRGGDEARAAPGASASAAAPPPPGPPPSAGPSDGPDSKTRDLAVLAFADVHGAEHVFGDVRARTPDAAWVRDVAFVECHHHGRLVVRGTFAGHWVDVENVAEAARQGTAEGAAAEVVAGLAFGPPAYAHDLAAGGAPGVRPGLLDAIRAGLPENSSGIVALAPAADADALIAAFHDRPARVTRHRFAPADAAALEAAVASAPPAAPGPQASSSIS